MIGDAGPAPTTIFHGHPLRRFAVALTTESLALAWARMEDAPEGAVVVADQELSPRQRKGPPWSVFPSRGLYFSIVLRPALPPEGEDLLWILGSVAAAQALEASGIEGVSLKWPDDVRVGGKKIAGVKVINQLGPGRIDSAIITFRVNLNVDQEQLPTALAGNATSCSIETQSSVDPSEILGCFLRSFDEVYDLGAPQILTRYRTLCDTLGRSVRAHLLPRGEVVGKAIDVDPFGTMLIAAGTRTLGVNVDSLKRLEYLLASES